MYYDYYYKNDGVLKRHTSLSQLSDGEISNIFGTDKKVLLLEPISFERVVIIEDEEGKRRSTEKVHVGYLGYVE